MDEWMSKPTIQQWTSTTKPPLKSFNPTKTIHSGRLYLSCPLSRIGTPPARSPAPAPVPPPAPLPAAPTALPPARPPSRPPASPVALPPASPPAPAPILPAPMPSPWPTPRSVPLHISLALERVVGVTSVWLFLCALKMQTIRTTPQPSNHARFLSQEAAWPNHPIVRPPSFSTHLEYVSVQQSEIQTTIAS